MLRLFVVFALIGVTVGLTGWLHDLHQELQRAPAMRYSNAPDYTFNDVVLTVMGVDGARSYRIEAPRITHFAVSGNAALVVPRIWFFQGKGPPLELHARRAWVTAAGKRILLPGKVDIVRPSYANHARLTVKTRNVTVFTNTEIASTNAPVAAVNGYQRLKSMGMRLNLAAGTLNLPSRVRSTYVP